MTIQYNHDQEFLLPNHVKSILFKKCLLISLICSKSDKVFVNDSNARFVMNN